MSGVPRASPLKRTSFVSVWYWSTCVCVGGGYIQQPTRLKTKYTDAIIPQIVQAIQMTSPKCSVEITPKFRLYVANNYGIVVDFDVYTEEGTISNKANPLILEKKYIIRSGRIPEYTIRQC